MPVMIALLRAVNVSGKSKVNMDELSTLCAALGHKDVRTYLQSGNVVFRTEQKSPSKIASDLEVAIEESLGVPTTVIARTASDLRATIANNPWTERNLEPSKLLVAYFQSRPSEEALARALTLRAGSDELHFAGREAFLYYPNGAGKATLNWGSLERMAKVPATTRNWNTTLKLLELCEAIKE